MAVSSWRRTLAPLTGRTRGDPAERCGILCRGVLVGGWCSETHGLMQKEEGAAGPMEAIFCQREVGWPGTLDVQPGGRMHRSHIMPRLSMCLCVCVCWRKLLWLLMASHFRFRTFTRMPSYVLCFTLWPTSHKHKHWDMNEITGLNQLF